MVACWRRASAMAVFTEYEDRPRHAGLWRHCQTGRTHPHRHNVLHGCRARHVRSGQNCSPAQRLKSAAHQSLCCLLCAACGSLQLHQQHHEAPLSISKRPGLALSTIAYDASGQMHVIADGRNACCAALSRLTLLSSRRLRRWWQPCWSAGAVVVIMTCCSLAKVQEAAGSELEVHMNTLHARNDLFRRTGKGHLDLDDQRCYNVDRAEREMDTANIPPAVSAQHVAAYEHLSIAIRFQRYKTLSRTSHTLIIFLAFTTSQRAAFGQV